MGLSAGVFDVVLASNDDATHLIDHPRIHFISFTGSVPVGWQINQLAAGRRNAARSS